MALTTSIKERRRELGMSQAELAQAVGCRRETIGNLEIGRYNPSLKLAWDIAEALGASIYDLFSFDAGAGEAGKDSKNKKRKELG